MCQGAEGAGGGSLLDGVHMGADYRVSPGFEVEAHPSLSTRGEALSGAVPVEEGERLWP